MHPALEVTEYIVQYFTLNKSEMGVYAEEYSIKNVDVLSRHHRTCCPKNSPFSTSGTSPVPMQRDHPGQQPISIVAGPPTAAFLEDGYNFMRTILAAAGEQRDNTQAVGYAILVNT